MSIDIAYSFLVLLFTNICVVYSFCKIKSQKMKANSKWISIAFNIMFSFVFAIICKYLSKYTYPFVMYIFCYISYLLVISIVLKQLDNSFYITMLVSICLSITLYVLSGFIVFNILSITFLKHIKSSIIEYVFIGTLQIILTFLFFKIKRFKDGFGFIKDTKFSKGLILMEVILIITMLVYIMFSIGKDIIIRRYVFDGIVIGMCIIIFLTKKFITKHYKLKMKDRTVELLNEQISNQNQTILELKEELSKVHEINHKYNHRISAMEKAVSKLKLNEEFAKENGEIIELVENLSKEYKEELESLEIKEHISITGLAGIDNILEYMCQEAKNNNIEFNVETNCGLKDIINIVPEGKLETLLADHINDAIIAINSSNNSNKKILTIFDKVNNIYQIKIYDTGIEFNIDTLLNLGKEKITTHKDTGRKWGRIYYNI